jgi:hypothetical protein
MRNILQLLTLKASRSLRVGFIFSLAIMSSAMATDLDHEVVFHIKSQPLDSALLEFSRQANTPVAFAAKSIGTLSTPGISGRYVARAALGVLLCNSGLVFTKVGETITVVPSSKPLSPENCAVPAGPVPTN